MTPHFKPSPPTHTLTLAVGHHLRIAWLLNGLDGCAAENNNVERSTSNGKTLQSRCKAGSNAAWRKDAEEAASRGVQVVGRLGRPAQPTAIQVSFSTSRRKPPTQPTCGIQGQRGHKSEVTHLLFRFSRNMTQNIISQARNSTPSGALVCFCTSRATLDTGTIVNQDLSIGTSWGVSSLHY